MSSGARPEVTTSRFYVLSAPDSDGKSTILSVTQVNTRLGDFDEDFPDNLTIFGDIPGDLIFAQGGGDSSARDYIGKTSSTGDYILYDSGGNRLYTNRNYQVGEMITIINEPVTVCYCAGTRLSSAGGEMPVENLIIGDHVITTSGEERPIRWIGHRTVICHGRADLLPVRIAAHAFGEGRPSRDLYVSPAHAICVDVLGEVLIPACRLINGTTITQMDVESVTYWHIELDSHDILLAEGLPAESYLDCGNRRFFANADVTDLTAVPDALPEGPLPFCRPFHDAGPLVDAVRSRLQDRAVTLGWRKVAEVFAGLHAVADGAVIRPDVDGLTVRFVIPAEARNVRLVSATSVPAHVLSGSSDDRPLGVSLASIVIDDGLTGARSVALNDPRLSEGFHPVDGSGDAQWRWTSGEAVLPASLWDGCRSTFFLRVHLSGPALPRWVGPSGTAGVVDLTTFRQRG